jgi:hypothetical protein
MLKIKDVDSFKKAFEQIAVFIDECNIHVNEDGLTLVLLIMRKCLC